MPFYLIVATGKHRGEKILLRNTQFVIGRDSSCHLRPVSRDVSKLHCALAPMYDRVELRDLKSSNGTYLNGKRISGIVRATHGDTLQVGPLQFVIQGLPEPLPAKDADSSVNEWLLRDPSARRYRCLTPINVRSSPIPRFS